MLLLLFALAGVAECLRIPANLHRIVGKKPHRVHYSVPNFGGNKSLDVHVYADMALIGSLDIGTPPQHFNVWFNQFINNTWILGNDAPHIPSTIGYERNVYFKDNSSTYQERNGTFEGFYGGGQNVSDVISIPGTDLAARYTFGDSDGLNMFGKLLFMALPADGMVGIANSLSDTFLSAMQNQLEQKIISIWTEGNVNGSLKQDAAITLGELNRHNCEADWHFVPQTVTYAWTVNFTAVSACGQKVGRSGVAMVVYSSILLTGPAKIVKPIVKLADAKLTEDGLYEVECKKVQTLPD
ncbi:pregnancy-associated glycoprotein 1, partial [Aphelenchoides avenae]